MWYYLQNGQQVGPVSKEELQGLLQSQSLPVTTGIWSRGMPEWVPANQVAEVIAGVTGGYIPQPVAGSPYARASAPAPNGMAIASMVLGIIGVLGAAILTSVPAIICGHIARRQIRDAEGRVGGEGMALTGLILGYLTTVLSVLAIGFVIVMIWVAVDAAGSFSYPSTPTPAPLPSAP
ncbi:MAG: DUF4190 domain-containing protein [Roseibacillus sp.]|nr:DUF4190 domain-containing protein [Verrucomicrobiota bacterium]